VPVTPVSVVVVSRNRPDHLRRCLTALGQLEFPAFEVIVVACPSGTSVASQKALPCDLSVLEFDKANISEARNIGIAHARGDVVAFMDDDAIPEPTWLAHLTIPFEDDSVAQSGGTTLGRNGISIQYAAAQADGFGVTHPVSVSGTSPVRLETAPDLVPRLHGTNMAVRRDVLLAHDGFDQRFRFYLDETDLSRRIALAGGGTVYVPNAVVHHASGPSVMRRSDRAPRHLFEIGASGAVFHKKHAGTGAQADARKSLFDDRWTWLLRHMQKGTLTPDDVHRLFRELVSGYEDGLGRKLAAPPQLDQRRKGRIRAVGTSDSDDIYLVATAKSREDLRKQAAQFVTAGNRVTVFDYSPSARFHRVTFTNAGYWLHTGGIYGREMRSEPLFQISTRAARLSRTLKRLGGIRSLRAILSKN
jgi:O-antigen biosynthesis protein